MFQTHITDISINCNNNMFNKAHHVLKTTCNRSEINSESIMWSNLRVKIVIKFLKRGVTKLFCRVIFIKHCQSLHAASQIS